MAELRRVAVTVEQCWHRVPGGTATSALESLRALQEHTDLDLIGVSARHAQPPPAPWVPPVPVAALPLPRRVLYEAWHRARWPAVQRATGPVDLIHVTGMAMPPKSAPMVVTVHDLAFLSDPGHFTRHGVRFFHRAIELARRDGEVVICPSQATFDDCVTYGFEPERLRVVPWGIEIDPSPPDAVAAVRRRHGLDQAYVLWTGTIEPRKNLPVLLEAFGALDRPDVDLVVVGPEGWNDELAAVEATMSTRVHRVGFVDPHELRALYAGAAVFCFPSIREGFGLPVLEAMAQGTPVVTSAGTATAEVVGEAGILVDAPDAAAITAALARLLDDADEAASLGAAGLQRSRTFSWARTAGLLVDAFRDAVGPGGGVRP